MQRIQYRSPLADMRVSYSTHYRRLIFQLLVASLLHFLTVSGEDPTATDIPTYDYDFRDRFTFNDEEETTTLNYDLIDYSEFEVIIHDKDPDFQESSGSFLQPGYVTLITFFLYLIHYIWH